MKILALIAALAALSACAGTTTGRKSECFGRAGTDGTYLVSRNRTNNAFLSTKNSQDEQDDCDFQSF